MHRMEEMYTAWTPSRCFPIRSRDDIPCRVGADQDGVPLMRGVNSYLKSIGTTIFTVMSALAVEHRAINLGQGFPDTEGPADVVQAAVDALKDGRNQYPPMPGLPELRQAVAAANRRFYGLDIDWAQEVTVTSGATEAITASLMAVLDPGDEVVLIEPLYDTYAPVVRMLGAIPRIVRLTPPCWDLPHAELADAFGPRTKAILFNSPMNPCGKVFSAEDLAFIAALVERHDTYAICDEVYEHLTFDGARHIPLMALPGMRERTMQLCGLVLPELCQCQQTSCGLGIGHLAPLPRQTGTAISHSVKYTTRSGFIISR